ncbi:MAG: phosphoribosyltransferase [Theionarchaea archaeon]|nr:phosphoribosyltransferase [Theionarchaea archaeon]MBU7037956.1 phosphoribosyltransferase [Theionarchaea archaeon]
MEKEYLHWSKVDEAIWTLADYVRKDYKVDIIVGIARGGLIPAVRMSHIMDNILMRVMDVKFYTDVEQHTELPEITVPLTEPIENKNILIVDDVADTGKTLKVVKEDIRKKGCRDVRIAVIAKKPQSIVDPDYYIFQTDRWIIFPWEKMPVCKKVTP